MEKYLSGPLAGGLLYRTHGGNGGDGETGRKAPRSVPTHSNPPKAGQIARPSGHENKLGGDTGEGCGRAIRPTGPRHGRSYGETEVSNPRYPIIHDAPITMAKGCGNKMRKETLAILPHPATV